MEATTNKFIVELQGVLVHLNCLLIQLMIINMRLLKQLLSLPLVGQTLPMPQLRIIRCNLQCFVVVSMRCIVILFVFVPVEEDVAAIEIDCWVRLVQFQSLIKVFFCFLVLIAVVIGKTTVIVVDARWLETYGLSIVN